MVKASVSSVGKSYKKLEPQIEAILKKLPALTKKGGFFVYPERSRRADVYLVDNTTMRKLNRVYRGKPRKIAGRSRGANKATNVLAFPAPKEFVLPPKTPKSLGEIYLAPDYIKKSHEDIVYLLIHGFLHLLGFDHEKKGDTMKMQRKEKQLLAKLRT